MKRLGPELKMPDLKPPDFLGDLYYDLRDRRLLPLVALIVVAIAAVPFLLGGDSEALPEGPGVAAGAGVVGADAAGLTVVEAKPGLRDYRKRLRRRVPSDPFEQQYAVPAGGAAQGAGGDSGGGGGSASGSGAASLESEETDEVVETVPVPGGGNPGGASTGSGKADPSDSGLSFYAFRPDVRFGVAGSGELAEYADLPLASLLPKQDPVLIFIGVSENGARAVFDISSKVHLVRGPGQCVGGKQSCGLLFLPAGAAVDLVTDSPDRTYRLSVVRIDFVKVDRPKPARSSRAGQPRVPGYSQNFSK